MGYAVSDETIYRWEKTGKLIRPQKLARNGRLLYTDKQLADIINFMQRAE